MRNRRSPSFGTAIYPSPSGNRREGQIGISPLMRCIQCGFPNDTRKTGWSDNGEGFGDAVVVTVALAPGQKAGTSDTKERRSVAGCRFCSSMKWRPTKPQELPDDRYRPSSEWYARKGRK